EPAAALSWRPRGSRPAPRAPHAPKETGGDRLPRAPHLALPVPHLALPGTAAQAPAGVCAGPTVAPLRRLRRPHGGDDERRAGATLVSGQESGLVRGACRPADAGDQHAVRPGPSRQRAETLRDAGVPSPRWPPTGVSHAAGTPLQPGALSASRPACRSVWRGSRRRTGPYRRLVPQSADPHVWRLSMSGDTRYH